MVRTSGGGGEGIVVRWSSDIPQWRSWGHSLSFNPSTSNLPLLLHSAKRPTGIVVGHRPSHGSSVRPSPLPPRKGGGKEGAELQSSSDPRRYGDAVCYSVFGLFFWQECVSVYVHGRVSYHPCTTYVCVPEAARKKNCTRGRRRGKDALREKTSCFSCCCGASRDKRGRKVVRSSSCRGLGA